MIMAQPVQPIAFESIKLDPQSVDHLGQDRINPSSPVDPYSDFTLDGSVDMKGRPVVKSRTGGWKAAGFIIGDELSERIAYYGIASNLITYLTTVLREGLATSVRNTNNWMGVTLVVPIVGGFFADAYWGRYWTVAIVSILYVLGLLFLTLAVSVRSLRPAPCTSVNTSTCPKATSGQLAFFFFALYLVSAGTGGVKPCLEAFGADQFDEEDPTERKKKSSFFNWWYFGLCIGGLFAVTVLVYIQTNVSWGLGFGIPTAAMAIACVLFFAGTPLYRHKPPAGSPLTHIAQVIVAALRNWNVKVPENENLLHEICHDASGSAARRQLLHTPELAFLDKAAVDQSSVTGRHSMSSKNPWKLCTVTQVEEVKLVLRVVPIWLTTFAYGVVFVQSSTFFTKQGATLDTNLGPKFKVPAASLQIFMTITVLLLVPVYDRIFVPLARRITGNERGITMLQRIGLGLFFSILCMVAAALTEVKRLRAAREHGLVETPKVMIPMTAFWLLPQYILLGIADVLTLVGQQEFFYDQVPDSMRSLGMALYLSAVGMGSFISSLLVTIANQVSSRKGQGRAWIVDNLNKCRLDYFYWLLAALSTINLVVFVIVAIFYKYKKVRSSVLQMHVGDHESPHPYISGGSTVRGLSHKDSLQHHHNRLSDVSQASSTW